MSNDTPTSTVRTFTVRKVILRCLLAPGDIVVMTAAIRDLQLAYPGQFLVDVRTSCPEIWQFNPYLTALRDDEPGVEIIPMECPLIDQSNRAPFHFLHSFIDFLNDRLGLRIKPTAFRGDIHLSDEEKSWASQVYEHTGQDIPYWLVNAGGKFDLTTKWWPIDRWQKVVDKLRGKIQFVQVGERGHHHPPLRGVIDLRGRTDLRQLIRLIYHSQGVLCGITAVMHLAAAVEVRPERPANRACVVIAGGREPVHWESYPDHQYLAANGLLRCCVAGGCWKSRTLPLGDGSENDLPENLCEFVVGYRSEYYPKCMEMITATAVIERVQSYFRNGVLNFLSPDQVKSGRRGVKLTQKNDFDQLPLTLSAVRGALRHFIATLQDISTHYSGRGIVLCGGGPRYFTNAWVCINRLRQLGCTLPIQLWHLGPTELDDEMRKLVLPLGVECINASAVARKQHIRYLGGWESKPLAILYSSFQEVLYLDADNVPVQNPEYLFESKPYLQTGALFWADEGREERAAPVWRACGLKRPEGPEFESGQILVDKHRCWKALRLALWFNENSTFFYQYLRGDKETFHLAFHRTENAYGFIRNSVERRGSYLRQHDDTGRLIFQHRHGDKWNLFLRQKPQVGFIDEAICINLVRDLRAVWSGKSRGILPIKPRKSPNPGLIDITAIVFDDVRSKPNQIATLTQLKDMRWPGNIFSIYHSEATLTDSRETQNPDWKQAIDQCVSSPGTHFLFLGSDVLLNRNLDDNLKLWEPLTSGRLQIADISQPRRREMACRWDKNWVTVSPDYFKWNGALLLSRKAACRVQSEQDSAGAAMDDILFRIPRLLRTPIFCHAPALAASQSQPGTEFQSHECIFDFDDDWHARRSNH